MIKLILRIIKFLDFGKSEGFVYDYNFFLKFVGVYLILLLLLSLIEIGF